VIIKARGEREIERIGYLVHRVRDPCFLVVRPDARLIIYNLSLLMVLSVLLFESAEEPDNI
jgi:hypothetical protein